MNNSKERRGYKRVATVGSVHGKLGLDLRTKVLELSVDGMLVELTVPLPVGSEHAFSLTIQREQLEVRGVVWHCEPRESGEEPPRYRLVIQFRGLDIRQRDVLERFVAQKLRS